MRILKIFGWEISKLAPFFQAQIITKIRRNGFLKNDLVPYK